MGIIYYVIISHYINFMNHSITSLGGIDLSKFYLGILLFYFYPLDWGVGGLQCLKIVLNFLDALGSQGPLEEDSHTCMFIAYVLWRVFLYMFVGMKRIKRGWNSSKNQIHLGHIISRSRSIIKEIIIEIYLL